MQNGQWGQVYNLISFIIKLPSVSYVYILIGYFYSSFDNIGPFLYHFTLFWQSVKN
ncbi:hypothetical protein ELI_2706 [Eubacterium callanderi]|uniref:Uncharacterized protein n=1 Tax=Eubacterium callanderi TaxID=53442 RepID=E3GE77_9FIRM|nr:hypothetical protein ELI_2706 [Eubacterium callanderi]